MKRKLTLLAAALILCFSQIYAQTCGTSGSTVCTSPATLTDRLYPFSDNIPCIVRGEQTDMVIEFKAPAAYITDSANVTFTSVRIDSIQNLPQGLCWASNKANDTYAGGESGCIKISGNTNALAGQYRLYITYTLDIQSQGQMSGIQHEYYFGAPIFLRVVNHATNICPPVDTTTWNWFVENENPDNHSIVRGKVYIDANTNGSYDIGEVGINNVTVNVGSISALTNASGDYMAYAPVANYTIAPVVPTNGAFSYPIASSTLNVVADGNIYSNNNFAAIVQPGFCDAQLSVITYTPPRPGFNNYASITFSNQLSATPLSQTIRLGYLAGQNFVSSDVTPTNIDATNRIIEWQVNNIASGSTWHADVLFNTPVSTPLGTVQKYTVSVLDPSCTSLVNANAVWETVVVGSYDPNDKAVSPIGYSDHHGINPTQVEELTYNVRFQNTGTYLAENVVIVDTISPHLNLSTLRVLSASHNYEVAIGDDRAVRFIFANIMLADSNSNEPESHGYVQFAIKLNASLTQNTQVTNKADIYFDFNDPIRTNTAYNTIDYTTSIKEAEITYNFNLFPNPTTGNVQINADEQLVGKTLKVSDLSGRVLLERVVDATLMKIQLSDLASGVYLIQVEGATKKIVKE